MISLFPFSKGEKKESKESSSKRRSSSERSFSPSEQKRCVFQRIQKYIQETDKSTWNTITPGKFYSYFLNSDTQRVGRTYELIDLRRPSDFEKYHVKGAKNIFWLKLFEGDTLETLPKHIPIFLICYVGHTASQTMTLLRLLGYNAIVIKYGYGVSPDPSVLNRGWKELGFPTVS